MNRWQFNKIAASKAAIYHLAIHALGIFGLAQIIGLLIDKLVPYASILSGLEPFYVGTIPAKVSTLVTYVAGVCLIFCWLVVAYFLIERKTRIDARFEPVSVRSLVLSGLIGLVTGFAILRGNWSTVPGIALVFIWGINFLYPIFVLLQTVLENKEAKKFYNLGRLASIMLIVSVTLSISWTCVMLIIGQTMIRNDFYDIPEQTYLSGIPVDNHQFINERHLFGLTKYDPRKGDDAIYYDQRLSIKIEQTAALKDFLSTVDVKATLTFQYDNKNGRLIARAPISRDNFDELWSIIHNNEDRIELANLYRRSHMLHQQETNQYYDSVENEFIKKNKFELREQHQLGRFFYHHHYMMAPILAHVNDVTGFLSVYGVGYTKTYAAVLQGFDAVNFQSYLKILYGSYLVYYILFVLLAFKIFERVESVGLVAIGAALPVILQLPETFLLAPGFSPARHLWDILALFLGLQYLRSEKKYYLFLLFLSVSIATWWNSQFGVFLFFAVTGVCLMHMQRGHWQGPILYLMLLASGQIAAVVLTEKTVNPLFKYMLLGFGAPENSTAQILMSIFIVALLGIALLYCKIRQQDKIDGIKWLLALGVYIYFAELMVYVLWYPAPHHLIGVALPWLILLLVFLVSLWPYHRPVMATIPAKYSLVTSLIGIMVFVPIIVINLYEWHSYNRVFANHVLHEWKSPGAKFTTTMEVPLFEDSVAMIHKYSPTGCIAMLSKYDVILPTLAGKCLVGPFVTTTDIFITRQESELLINSFIEKADVIYIDSDIERLYIGEIPDEPVKVRGQKVKPILGAVASATGRAAMFSNFSGIYEKLSERYQLEKRGPLISVYRRKS